jgi:uncharacterized protein RhaS with RHS repeats
MTTVTDTSGTALRTAFDLLGRKASEKIGKPSVPTWLTATVYGYDAAGNVTSVTDPTAVTTGSLLQATSSRKPPPLSSRPLP